MSNEEPDWSFLQDKVIMTMARYAANFGQLAGYGDASELLWDCLTYLATHAAARRKAGWVGSRYLCNKAIVAPRMTLRGGSDAMLKVVSNKFEMVHLSAIPDDPGIGGYTRERVLELMPLVHDSHIMEAFKPERDREMPGSKADPSHANSNWAESVDMREAWRIADLTELEAQVLLLVGALFLSRRRSATILGTNVNRVSNALLSGLDKMIVTLNGDSPS